VSNRHNLDGKNIKHHILAAVTALLETIVKSISTAD